MKCTTFASRELILLGVVAACGLAVPAPAGETVNTRYLPTMQQLPVAFEDGRVRFADGAVSPMPDGRVVGGDPEDLGPASICCAPGTSQKVLAIVQQYMTQGYESRYNADGRWSMALPGSPLNLTWSFVPDGLVSGSSGMPGGAVGSILFSRMDALFGTRATWITQFTNCFARWQALTGVNYTRIQFNGQDWDDGAAWGSAGSTTRGDVRIAMHNIDGVNGILAYNQFPDNGDMLIDSSENWAATSGTYRFLRNVVMHEHGHGLGLSHTCPVNNTKLMEPFASTSFDGPQQDDMRGVQFNYGDLFEPNNTPGTAYDFGTPGLGIATTLGAVPAPAVAGASVLSITPGDNDYFKLNLVAPHLVNITATPVGSTYTDLDQNADGSCQSTPTNNTNSLVAGDLIITVYASNGTTVLRTQNANAAGSNEVVTGILLNTGTDYFKVSCASGQAETQMYTLSMTVASTSLQPAATDGTFTDRVRITWPAVPDATGYSVMRNTVDNYAGAFQYGTTDGSTTTFDDMTAVPGTTYFYYIRAQQTGNTGYRFMSTTGSSGFANVAPIANAGPDQAVTDSDNSGAEMVTLNGSASNDPNGTITNYRWSEGATTLAQGPSATANVLLTVGLHTITLTVTDNLSATGTDTVNITVEPGAACNPDYNQDGSADTSDVLDLANDIASGLESFPGSSPDFNNDGSIDSSDVLDLANTIASGNCP